MCVFEGEGGKYSCAHDRAWQPTKHTSHHVLDPGNWPIVCSVDAVLSSYLACPSSYPDGHELPGGSSWTSTSGAACQFTMSSLKLFVFWLSNVYELYVV